MDRVSVVLPMIEMGLVLIWLSTIGLIFVSGIGGLIFMAILAWTTWRPGEAGLFLIGCAAGALGTIVFVLWSLTDWTQPPIGPPIG